MATHQEYIDDFDATVALLKTARRDFDRIADDMLELETVRAEADAEALGITEKLGLLDTERMAYLARHATNMRGPSDEAVARSLRIAADLSRVIAAANRLPTILASLTKLFDGLVKLGKPFAEKAASPAPLAKLAEPIDALAHRVTDAKEPALAPEKSGKTRRPQTGSNVKAVELDDEQIKSTSKVKTGSPSNRSGTKPRKNSKGPARNT